MLVEVKVFEQYDKTLSLEQFEVLKEFYPDAKIKCDFTYEINTRVKVEMYKKSFSVVEVEESVAVEWYDKLNSDERSLVQLEWNISKPKPVIDCTETIIVDMDLWNERWRWPYRVVRTVKVHKKTDRDGLILSNLNSVLDILDEKLETINTISKNLEGNTFNQKCNVHIGGGMLVQINRVKLLENSCTDALQMELNSGWRILAVNVQADQRRPDYILGRYDVGYDYSSDSAVR